MAIAMQGAQGDNMSWWNFQHRVSSQEHFEAIRAKKIRIVLIPAGLHKHLRDMESNLYSVFSESYFESMKSESYCHTNPHSSNVPPSAVSHWLLPHRRCIVQAWCGNSNRLVVYTGFLRAPWRRKRRLEQCKRSRLVEKMIHMVSRGQVSVANAADLARCAVDDGLLSEAVQAFSSLGNSGAAPSNCERDMTRWLRNLFGFTLEPYTVTLHLQVVKV